MWKARLVILILAVSLFLIGAHWLNKAPIPKASRSAADIHERLIADYQAFNDAWYDGALPKDTTILYYSSPGYSIGETTQTDDKFEIFINSYYDRDLREAELTEFHEMCHVKVEVIDGPELEDHGPKWVKCMRERAAAGAFDNLW